MSSIHLPAFQAGLAEIEDGVSTPYVLIEGGPTQMVVVPGVPDGLRTCVDVAVHLAWFYRERVQSCRILILSRREPLPSSFGVERHAEDMIRAVDRLGYGGAVWECLSAAGPIGQWVAIKRPDLVRGLVLSSSYAHVAGRLKKKLQQWLEISQESGDRDPFWSALEPKYRPPAEVLAQVDPALLHSAARSPERFQRILQELLELDQRELLGRIKCPALVIGGADDRLVPPEVQREMAACIPNCRLELCAGYGHFNDMENPAYHNMVTQFSQTYASSNC